jgi:hypothetical protein
MKKSRIKLLKSNWHNTLFIGVALLVGAGMVTVLTRNQTKPESASAATLGERFGLGNFHCDNVFSNGCTLNQLSQYLDKFTYSNDTTKVPGQNELGLKTIRIDARWSSYQEGNCPKAGTMWTNAEREWCAENLSVGGKNLFDDLNDKGIRVFGVLGYAPRWARHPNCVEQDHCQPATAKIYGIFAGKMAAYYGRDGYGNVNDWELWNESNEQHFMTTHDGNTNPTLYANMIKEAHTRIHAVDSDANVVAGSTSGRGDYVPGGSAGLLDPRAYWLQMFQVGENATPSFNVGDFVDNLSHHAYIWSNIEANRDNYENWYMMYRNVDDKGTANQGDDVNFACPASVTALKALPNSKKPSLKCIFNVYGHKFAGDAGTGRKLRIWNSEYGAPVGKFHRNNSPSIIEAEIYQDDQAADFQEAANTWLSYPWAGNLYFFRLIDHEAPINIGGDGKFTTAVPAGTHNGYMGILEAGSDSNFGCSGTNLLTATGRAKKSYCQLKKIFATTAGASAPTVSLSSSDETITAGSSVTLTWNVSGSADSCTGTGGGLTGWNGDRAHANGTHTLNINPGSTRTYTITCSNESGSTSADVTVTTGDVPVVTLVAAPTTVASGGSSTLTWTVANSATSCTASGNWMGSKAAGGGSQTMTGLTADRTYNLVCSNDFGSSTPLATVDIEVNSGTPPTVNFTISKTSMKAGESAILTWSSSGATACSSNGSWTGTRATSGTLTVTPIDDSLYNLRCTNSTTGLSMDANTGIDVTPSLINGDIANPPNGNGCIDANDLSFLITRWGSANARADLDNDGTVFLGDFSRWVTYNVQGPRCS